jgi:hypothetical protein
LAKRIDDQSTIFWNLLKETKANKEALTVLTSGIHSVLSKVPRKPQLRYPLPAEAKQIEETIKDHLQTEIGIMKNLKVSMESAKTMEKVTIYTCRTYPMIVPKYIARKVLAYFETLTSKMGGPEKEDRK